MIRSASDTRPRPSVAALVEDGGNVAAPFAVVLFEQAAGLGQAAVGDLEERLEEDRLVLARPVQRPTGLQALGRDGDEVLGDVLDRAAGDLTLEPRAGGVL